MKTRFKFMAVLFVLLTATQLTAEEPDVLSIVEANFKAADADGNESLDPTEFQSLIDANAENEIGRAATVKRFGAYKRAFKRADQNSDGRVAWSEILSAPVQ